MTAIEVQPSLFPEPLTREAHFLDDCRIELVRSFGRQGPRALVVGHNPSNASGTREDPTSLWWNRWFQHFGYSGYSAGNLYPFVSPSPDQCYARVTDPTEADYTMMLRNLDEVWQMARRADRVFVCFGNLPRDEHWLRKFVLHLRDASPVLWCWGTTASGMPTHPMARGKHRLDPLVAAQEWRWN